MSMIRPEPALSCPNSALRYHWESHAVRGLLSIAYFAVWLSSLPGSADGLVSASKPLAPTGRSELADVSGVLRPGLG